MFPAWDVRSWPMVERKVLLWDLLPMTGTVQALSWLRNCGEAVFGTAVELALEGVVAKRLDSRYTAGRNKVWLKIKNPDYSRQEANISAARSANVSEHHDRVAPAR